MFEIAATDPSTVVLSGRFDASQAEKAEAVLDNVSGHTTLDCRKLDYISSAGIGVILATYKRLDESGATLSMTHVNQHVRQVFHYAGLDKIIALSGD